MAYLLTFRVTVKIIRPNILPKHNIIIEIDKLLREATDTMNVTFNSWWTEGRQVTHILKYFLKQKSPNNSEQFQKAKINKKTLNHKRSGTSGIFDTYVLKIKSFIKNKKRYERQKRWKYFSKKEKLRYPIFPRQNHFQVCCLTQKLHLVQCKDTKFSFTGYWIRPNVHIFILLMQYRLHKVSSKLNLFQHSKARILSSNFTSRQQQKLN